MDIYREKNHLVREWPPKLIFPLEQLNRYTGKEEIAKDTIIAKLTCHDLDKPPDTVHYAPSSGPVGSGQLFEQVPNADNFIQVSPGGYHSRELSQENGVRCGQLELF